MLKSLFGRLKNDPYGGYDRTLIQKSKFLNELFDYNITYGVEQVYDVIYFLKVLNDNDSTLFNKIYLTWINENIDDPVERIKIEFKIKFKITPKNKYASLLSFNNKLKKLDIVLDPKFKNLNYYAEHNSIYLSFHNVDDKFHKSLIISENDLNSTEYIDVIKIIDIYENFKEKNYSEEKFNKEYEKYYKFYNFLVHKYALKNYDKLIKDEIFGFYFYCYDDKIISILDKLTDDQMSNLSNLCSITPKKISDTKINESKIKQNIEIFNYNKDFFNNLYNDNKQKIDELFGIITVKIIIYI